MTGVPCPDGSHAGRPEGHTRPGDRWAELPAGDCPECGVPLEWCRQIGDPPYRGRRAAFRWTRHVPLRNQPRQCGSRFLTAEDREWYQDWRHQHAGCFPEVASDAAA